MLRSAGLWPAYVFPTRLGMALKHILTDPAKHVEILLLSAFVGPSSETDRGAFKRSQRPAVRPAGEALAARPRGPRQGRFKNL